MKNLITNLEIKNFKSIKHIKMDCKRVNLLIGKPNVGKSNILEALSLFCAPYSNLDKKYFSDFIRYVKFENLFYDEELGNKIEILTNIGVVYLRYHFNIDKYDLILGNNKNILEVLKDGRAIGEIENSFDEYVKKWEIKNASKDIPIKPYYKIIHKDGGAGLGLEKKEYPIKKYEFRNFEKYENRYHHFLLPPYGTNLYTMVQRERNLYQEITSFFKEYKVKFRLNKKENNFEIQKDIKGVIYSYPYFTIAETLQRIIFYLMAIETNKNSVLLFEEPEAHSFPPYVRKLAEKIIDAESNQFFVSTHSPFILNTIIENAPKEEVAVFVISYERFQTNVRELSEKEIGNMLNYGTDIFFNLK